ncbi:DUF5677 domain-containing protein [Acinetobacter corruptisaponis]|uniref:DUF5677 domain-containing protein n=1 Tax=Acinetobacter corruptisaponis TaxID=3045147 RepID=A0ABY8S018_9GAMM|nr:DUF5677 domain-containing protein [Acinetobacter sp. KCTC 92772]WHP04918.1 DUF5677 domain-containing protein [Acinetobacter sp. KCTC 92772]
MIKPNTDLFEELREGMDIINIDKMTFQKSLSKYVKISNLSRKVSKLVAGRLVDYRKGWASILFTKICVISITLKKLVDHDTGKKYALHWDFSSAFSLVRNLMECYQTFYYLCIDNISDDEALARKKLFNYHDFMARGKLFYKIGNEEVNAEIKERLISELESTNYFNQLDVKQKKHYLKGDTAFFLSREEIEERIGNSKNHFKINYQLLSSYTHSYPMGFYRMLEADRGTGVKTEVEEKYTAFSLSIAEVYLSLAIIDMLELFPDILDKISKQEIQLLNIEYKGNL